MRKLHQYIFLALVLPFGLVGVANKYCTNCKKII
ncbi:MAG: hypothetical protein RIR11_2303 [Bacteroidota bacterium]|jgi:hypothetical protein